MQRMTLTQKIISASLLIIMTLTPFMPYAQNLERLDEIETPENELIFDTIFLSEKAATNTLLYSVLAFDDTWGGQLISLREVLYQDPTYNEMQIMYQQCIFNIIKNNKEASLINKDRMIQAGCEEHLNDLFQYVSSLADEINQ